MDWMTQVSKRYRELMDSIGNWWALPYEMAASAQRKLMDAWSKLGK